MDFDSRKRWLFEFLLIFFNLALFVSVASRNTSKKINLHNVSKQFENSTATINPTQNENKKTRILFTGDVMLGRNVMVQSKKSRDYKYPFLRTADVLKDADLTVINLENPVIENCPFHDSGYTFCSEPESVEGLKFAGIDIASLVNNHSLNYGHD